MNIFNELPDGSEFVNGRPDLESRITELEKQAEENAEHVREIAKMLVQTTELLKEALK